MKGTSRKFNGPALTQLPHLDTFVRAAELSSFTAAAKALGLTQAAISQRVQALEQFLDVPLFTRQAGHVLVTEAGRQLYDYALRILLLHREAIGKVTGRQGALTGDLALAASSVAGEHFLPDLLARFRERHPHVRVRASVTDSRDVLQQVEQGRVHLGLLGGRDGRPHLEFRCFAFDTLVLVVPPRHGWARRRRVRLAQLALEPLIVREAGSGSRWCLEQAIAKAGRTMADLHVALELGSNEAIQEAVQRGLGVAVLSAHAVDREIAAGQLHALAIADLPLQRGMFAVWDRRRVLPIPARLFLDQLGPEQQADRVP